MHVIFASAFRNTIKMTLLTTGCCLCHSHLNLIITNDLRLKISTKAVINLNFDLTFAFSLCPGCKKQPLHVKIRGTNIITTVEITKKTYVQSFDVHFVFVVVFVYKLVSIVAIHCKLSSFQQPYNV